jgi:hypothetical protein
MGKISSRSNSVVQQLSSAVGGMWASPTLFQNGTNSALVYFGGKADTIKSFSLTNGLFATTPVAQSSNTFAFPGTTTSLSANGTTNGLVWALDTSAYSGSGAEVLYAYNATTMAMLYNSNLAAGSRDVPGAAVKFAVPTVANGMVYVGTETSLTVFGLLGVAAAPQALMAAVVAPGSPDPPPVAVPVPVPDGVAGEAAAISAAPPRAAAPFTVSVPVSSDLASMMALTGMAVAEALASDAPAVDGAGSDLVSDGPDAAFVRGDRDGFWWQL